MKKFKITALTLLVIALASFNGVAQATGVGFINYAKVLESYPFAKDAYKEVDAKTLELQQYLVDKEKEYKSLDTPLKKKNFEEKTKKELDAKKLALYKFKVDKENLIYEKVQEAAKEVLVEQKIDAIIDANVIFVGGFDVTQSVIDKLKK